MTAREKHKEVYDLVKGRISDLERTLADMLVNNASSLGDKTFNTIDVHQKIGALKELRMIIS